MLPDIDIQKERILKEEEAWARKNGPIIENHYLRASIICDASRLKDLKEISTETYKKILVLIKSK